MHKIQWNKGKYRIQNTFPKWILHSSLSTSKTNWIQRVLPAVLEPRGISGRHIGRRLIPRWQRGQGGSHRRNAFTQRGICDSSTVSLQWQLVEFRFQYVPQLCFHDVHPLWIVSRWNKKIIYGGRLGVWIMAIRWLLCGQKKHCVLMRRGQRIVRFLNQ